MSEDDYIGKRFLTRVCIGTKRKKGRGLQLMLQCDCGRVGSCFYKHAGKQGCRCMPAKKHGYSPSGKRTPTYRSWQKMMDRCRNTNHHAYGRYGGRGIAVCDKWIEFSGFLDDMGERPDGMSLDRIDNDRGYTKDNCRWATYKQQQRNKRTNNRVTINGVTRCVREWAELSGIRAQVLYYRVRHNWPEDKLLSPVEYRKPRAVVFS